MTRTTLTVPDIGGVEDAEVIEVSVAVGDPIEPEQSLIVLESDKASMEIPATQAGTVLEILVKEGDQLAEGAAILVLETAVDAPAPAADAPASAVDVPAPEVDTAAPAADAPAPEVDTPASAVDTPTPEVDAPAPAVDAPASAVDVPAATAPAVGIYAGPAVRKLAREFGVDLSRVTGSGPKGRILKDDIQNHVKQSLQAGAAGTGAGIPAIPAVDFAAFGEVDIQPLDKIGRVTAANMQRSWLNVPHVTQFDEVDVTAMEAFRAEMKAEAEQRGVKLTPLPFLLKACAAALKDNPRLNASLAADGEHLVYKQYVHIGMAVDTPAGLLVPVIRDVDRKSLWELAAEIAELAARAQQRKLKPIEMQGGCFSISSLGNIGGTGFTPIVNAPEVAILGVSRLQLKPVWNGSEFEPRRMLPLSLSYDHRVVNGADGGRFMAQLKQLLHDIRRLLL